MGNFTTGAYGSIPIVISPRSIDPVAVKETSPTVKTDASASDGESQNWRQSYINEKLRSEFDATAKPVTTEEVQEAYDTIESAALLQGKQLRFEEDAESGINIIKIVDSESGDVIRQLPPEDLVQMARKLKNFGRGWVDLVG